MRDTITLSLPNAMTRQIEKACRREHRTRSELMREALRVYFGTERSIPTYTPTKAELDAIRKGREEIRRGEYYTLDGNSTPPWQVITADRAQRTLARIPERDRARRLRAIDEMAS